jgi:hypothetical protein
MLILILIGIVLGAVLGLRFRMFVLVPVFCATIPFVVAHGVSRGDELWRVALEVTALIIFVQLGYTFGAGSRFALREGRAVSHRRASMPTSARMSNSI